MTGQNIITKALKIDRQDSNTYTCSIGQEQRFGEFLHGGFTAALLFHAALKHTQTTLNRTEAQNFISCQYQYLLPVDKSEIQLHVETLKITKSNLSLRVLLNQNGRPAVTGDINLVSASADRGLTYSVSPALNPPPPAIDVQALASNTDKNWALYHVPYFKGSTTQPLSHWNLFFSRTPPEEKHVHNMWISLHDQNALITDEIVPLAADIYLRQCANYEDGDDFSYTACIERAKRAKNGEVRLSDLAKTTSKIWTATQSLSLEIIRPLPAGGVKYLLHRSVLKAIRNGRATAEVTLIDVEGNVIAYGKAVDTLVPIGKWAKDGGGDGRVAKL